MEYKYEDYLNLGIYPDIVGGELRFSKGNIDYIIDKYLKMIKDFDSYKARTSAIEHDYDNQYMMVRADVEYYRSKYSHCAEELKELKLNNKRYDRIDEINAGLRQECRKYKEELLKLKIKADK